ncbi:MAG: hypothetical protein C0616_10370 [Desulfuromonas sp.]|nr:MAG: hypothetical protein C0616_10370 [Desulfuromonas sp.]
MFRFPFYLLLTVFVLSGCMVGPTYQPPQPEMPASFQPTGPWRVAVPKAHLPRDGWWRVFNDPELDRLEIRAMADNPELQIILARVARARAGVSTSEAGRYPRLDLNPLASRSRTARDFSGSDHGTVSSFFDLPLDLGYEIDLWGRVRHTIEAAEANLEAGMADYQGALLSLQAEVARAWFSLRTLDSDAALLAKTIELRQKNLELIQSRYDAGETSKLDLERARTELSIAQAETEAVARHRDELVHTLAVLIGEQATGFDVAEKPLDLDVPAVAPDIPSSLLERRPDIAAAERRMAAANAGIGLAHAAFYPEIRLFGNIGFQSATIGDLFEWDNRTWGLGPSVSLPIFDGGRNRSNLQRAEAAWNEMAAAYRQKVLLAIGEVEIGLSSLHYLERQAAFLNAAVASSRSAAELSRKRYRAGLVSYFEVVDTERTLLSAERQSVSTLGQQLESTIYLVKALGGGWDEIDGSPTSHRQTIP